MNHPLTKVLVIVGDATETVDTFIRNTYDSGHFVGPWIRMLEAARDTAE